MTSAQREALAVAYREGRGGPFGVSYQSHGIDPSTLRSLEAKGYMRHVRGQWYEITPLGARKRLEVVTKGRRVKA